MRIHHVFANRSNVGDWLSARGIQQLLREAHPDLAIREHLVDEPFVAGTVAALSAAHPDDLIVIGGGGLFMDYFEPFWVAFEPLSLRRPFAIWGVGLVDLKAEQSLPSRDLVAAIVSRARLAVVRDELTRRFVDLPLPPAVPCPSLAAVPVASAGRGLLHVNNYTTVGAPVYDAMRRTGRRWATATDRVYRETNNRIEPGREDQLGEILRRYALSDIVVSSALHGCVIAVAMGRPVVAVSGDRKIEAFMEAADLSEWVVDTTEAARIAAMLGRIDEQPFATAFVEQAVQANRDVARRMVAALSPA